ncbi:hypothetical protein ACSSZE_14610 [Acidithiobacillus caldus]
MTALAIPVLYKVRAFLRTAIDYWLHWTILFINLFVFSPLLVFVFLLIDKGSFSFAVWVTYCHDYYNTLFPFVGFTAGLLYTFRFGLSDRYHDHIYRMLMRGAS